MEGIIARSLNWHVLAGALIAYYFTLVVYRLTFHPLAHFPGPRIAAISRWYEAYYDVALGGKYTFKIAALHEKYGPIIRISPYELHVVDPTFFETLYRNDGRWDKYAWSSDAFGAKSSTIWSSGHDAHKLRRSAIAPFFSKQNIALRQDIIKRSVSKLCQRVHAFGQTQFNLGAAISAFVRDVANEYILDKQYNELDQEDFGIALSIQSLGAGVFWRTTKHIRWFGPALRSIPPTILSSIADEGTKSFLDHIRKSEQDTRDILASALSTSSPKRTLRNMIDAIIRSNLPPAEKSFPRIFEEVATVTGAATETTAGVLRLVLYHVYTDKTIFQRLREEIVSASASSEPITLKMLEQLPYLTATLMEGMRLSPAIASRETRVTNQNLLYNQWCIPAGTPVGMTTILMHTSKDLYPDPMRFSPDRWMDPKIRGAMYITSKYAPFSRGPRMCLGIHMAWAEMYLLLATLVRNFDFTIHDAKASDFEAVCDNFAIGTKAGCNLKVHVNSCTQ